MNNERRRNSSTVLNLNTKAEGTLIGHEEASEQRGLLWLMCEWRCHNRRRRNAAHVPFSDPGARWFRYLTPQDRKLLRMWKICSEA